MTVDNAGLRALTTSDERTELQSVGARRVKLQYLKGSKQKMGMRLWNVLSPRVAGYRYGKDSGFPTFSLDTLRAKGLI
jgi:hypothetical protein